VAIGLIFIYLLLSLVTSAIKEGIESWLKMRAMDLEKGIRELLHDSKGDGFAKKFFDHPLICSLYKGDYKPGATKGLSILKGTTLPSYIPARTFALALMDIVLPAEAGRPSGAAGATASSGTPAAPGAVTPLAPAPTSSQSLRDAISKISDDAKNVR